MVYRRSYTKRRTYRKRPSANRSYRRKFTQRSRAVGHPKDKVHYFKRKVVLDPISVLTPGNVISGSYAFRLSDLPAPTDFSSLYDQYKIKGVKIYFIPVSNVVVGITGGVSGHPGTYFSNRLFTAIDYNDGTAPTSVDQMREYQNSKWTPYNRIHKRWIRPAVSAVPSSGETLQWPGKSQPWVPTTNNAVYYFGLKYAMDSVTGITPPSTGDLLYQVEATYYLSFKGPR